MSKKSPLTPIYRMSFVGIYILCVTDLYISTSMFLYGLGFFGAKGNIYILLQIKK